MRGNRESDGKAHLLVECASQVRVIHIVQKSDAGQVVT